MSKPSDSEQQLAVFGGVLLVVLIGAVSDCRTAACWGAGSSHNASELLQLNSKWGAQVYSLQL